MIFTVRKTTYSLIGSALFMAHILLADYLYANGLIALNSFIYQIDMLLLSPSYFIMAAISGCNRASLGDVPYYVFKVLSFLIYFVVLYFAQVVVGKINDKNGKEAEK